jgi:hypothetical protein
MTNIVKFVRRFSEQKFKMFFDEQIKELVDLNEQKDRSDYIE